MSVYFQKEFLITYALKPSLTNGHHTFAVYVPYMRRIYGTPLYFSRIKYYAFPLFIESQQLPFHYQIIQQNL